MLRRRPAVHPEAISGLVDAMLTIAVTLCNAGLLSREEVAAAFDESAGQQQQQQLSEARKAPVAAIRAFFHLPVAGEQARSRLEVITGGRGES